MLNKSVCSPLSVVLLLGVLLVLLGLLILLGVLLVGVGAAVVLLRGSVGVVVVVLTGVLIGHLVGVVSVMGVLLG